MLKFSIITLFPDIFTPHLSHLPLKRALEKGLITVDLIDLRNFAIDKRGTVDSPAYGGGPGMILRPEPIFDAINCALSGKAGRESVEIIFLTPRGQTYIQETAQKLSSAEHIIIVCGRYEGMDQRVIDHFMSEEIQERGIHALEISIGNYVLSGGEVPAMVITESITRLVPGAIDNAEALDNESYNPENPGKKEHPQYSRPETWMGISVPETLISGHHGNIKKWKETH